MIQKVSFVGYDKEEGKEYRNKLKDESEETTGIKIMDDNQYYFNDDESEVDEESYFFPMPDDDVGDEDVDSDESEEEKKSAFLERTILQGTEPASAITFMLQTLPTLT